MGLNSLIRGLGVPLAPPVIRAFCVPDAVAGPSAAGGIFFSLRTSFSPPVYPESRRVFPELRRVHPERCRRATRHSPPCPSAFYFLIFPFSALPHPSFLTVDAHF